MTSGDGKTTQTYTITVTKLSTSDAATDTTLASLSLSVGTLSPAFSPGRLSYTATVPSGTDTVTVTATANADGAKAVVVPASPVTLTDGETIIKVTVTASGGKSRAYSVTVTKPAAGASTDATLSALSLDAGTLSPEFARGTYKYTTKVANSVADVTVTATPRVKAGVDGTSIVYKLNGNTQTDGDDIPLSTGSNNKIEVIVTAADGSTTRTYEIRVTRLGSAGDADATLADLSLSDVTLSPSFSSGHETYTATVGNSDADTDVTAAVNVTGATTEIELNGGSTGVSGTTVTLDEGLNTITVEVTATDTTTKKTYTVKVTKLAASDDADLSSLSLSGMSLDQSFKASRIIYTATVNDPDDDGMTTTVTATASHSEADLEYSLDGTVDKDNSIDLTQGANTVKVKVTAENGTTTKTYTISVTVE